MKRREPKLPRGPKPAQVNAVPMDPVQQLQLAERIAMLILARLRTEAPQLFTAPVEAPRA